MAGFQVAINGRFWVAAEGTFRLNRRSAFSIDSPPEYESRPLIHPIHFQ